MSSWWCMNLYVSASRGGGQQVRSAESLFCAKDIKKLWLGVKDANYQSTNSNWSPE